MASFVAEDIHGLDERIALRTLPLAGVRMAKIPYYVHFYRVNLDGSG